jgi:hypothetical protein
MGYAQPPCCCRCSDSVRRCRPLPHDAHGPNPCDFRAADIDTEAEAEEFTDQRPRLVTLTPKGSYWEGRARRIMSYISAHSHACDGLIVLEDAVNPEHTVDSLATPPG